MRFSHLQVKTIAANPVTTIRDADPPMISGVTLSGTNLVFSVTGGFSGGPYDLLTSTNVALPLTNWTVLSSGDFDSLGNVTITNGINPAAPQRFFTVRVPWLEVGSSRCASFWRMGEMDSAPSDFGVLKNPGWLPPLCL